MKYFKILGGVKKVAVSYASRDHLLKRLMLGCFHGMFRLFCEQDNAFSALSAFQIKVTNRVLSVLSS